MQFGLKQSLYRARHHRWVGKRGGDEGQVAVNRYSVCEMINALHHELSENAKAADGMVTEMMQTCLVMRPWSGSRGAV